MYASIAQASSPSWAGAGAGAEPSAAIRPPLLAAASGWPAGPAGDQPLLAASSGPPARSCSPEPGRPGALGMAGGQLGPPSQVVPAAALTVAGLAGQAVCDASGLAVQPGPVRWRPTRTESASRSRDGSRGPSASGRPSGDSGGRSG